jgi:hypothetical protein
MTRFQTFEMNSMGFVPYELLVRRARYVIIYMVQ